MNKQNSIFIGIVAIILVSSFSVIEESFGAVPDPLIFDAPVEFDFDDISFWLLDDFQGSEFDGVHILFHNGTDGSSTDTDGYYYKSVTGETDVPILLFPKIIDTYTSNNISSNVFAFDGVVLAYMEYFGDITDRVYQARSTDGGETFSPLTVVSDEDSVYCCYPHHDMLTVTQSTDGDLFLMVDVYDETVTDSWIMRTFKSTDLGLNWSDQGLITGFAGWLNDTNVTPLGVYETEWGDDSFIIDGDTIHVALNALAYVEGYNHHYYTRSDDEGLTWLTTDLEDPLQLDDVNVFELPNEEEWNKIFMNDNGDLIVMWGIGYDTVGDIGYNRSFDGGDTWEGESTYDGVGFTCDFDLYSGSHTVDWQQFDNFIIQVCNTSPDSGIWAIYSDDFGATWSETQLATTPVGGWYGHVNSDKQATNIAFTWTFEDNAVPFDSSTVSVYYSQDPISIDNFSLQVEPLTITNGFGLWDGEDGDSPDVQFTGNDLFVHFEDQSSDHSLFFLHSFLENTNRPSITLIGDNFIALGLNDEYVETGAVCSDVEDGTIAVTIGGDVVDTSIAGSYFITYDCQDSELNNASQKIRHIQVASVPQVELWHVDIICEGESIFDHSEIVEFLEICNVVGASPPVITLLGDAITQVDIGSIYLDDGSTAFDNKDGDVTSSIVTSGIGAIDTSALGVFFITYNVVDSNGNIAEEKIRTVVVAEAGSSSSGGGSTGGSSVGNPPPDELNTDFDIEDLDSNQVSDLLKLLAPALETTIIQEIIQTFFEFDVLDNEHNNIPINSFLSNERLGIRWSTGDDIVVTSVVPASSPFTFTFETLPIIKEGSGSAISENSLSYNLQVPSNQCGAVFSFDCVDTIRYSVPVTVHALINGTEVNNVGTILVDLTQDDINPILIILFFTIAIPIVAGIVWKAKGGHNPSNVKDLLK